ncbi:MAG TPA: hypothetical protein VGC07_05145 [Granulicella sp.]
MIGPLLLVVALLAPEAQPTVSFRFDRPIKGVVVPHYTIELHADGTGQYHAELASGQAVDRELTVTSTTMNTLLEDLRQLRSSGGDCNLKAKNIADTGTKVIMLTDPEGNFGCTWNSPASKIVEQLNYLLFGLETTLEAGRSLEFKHRFDHLGLDAEMQNLSDAVKDGRAIELGNIASTLSSIARDTELIQRVRTRASSLLAAAQGH